MILKNIEPFIGEHCETVATGTLLKHIGISWSEPMLFGLGSGLAYYLYDTDQGAFPFLAGRVAPGELTANIVKRLSLDWQRHETDSAQEAWEHVQSCLAQQHPLVLQLDCYHLDYFKTKHHFPAHFVAIIGYDEQDAYLVDTCQQGTSVKTSLESLRLARSQSGPLSSRHLSWTLSEKESLPNLKDIIPSALLDNAKDYLLAESAYAGYRGLLTTAEVLKTWLERPEGRHGFARVGKLMERGGTGGANFRYLYRDFLKEAAGIIEDERVPEAYQAFCDIAKQWSELAEIFMSIEDIADAALPKCFDRLAYLLKNIAEREKAVMSLWI